MNRCLSSIDSIEAKGDTMSTGHERNAAATALPAVDGDFYQIAGLLTKAEQLLHGRHALSRLRLPRRERAAGWVRGNGDIACGPVDRDVFRRPQWAGDGIDLP